ncbi:hypothetical protein ES703_04576 [subsurface metagenome]
MLWGLSRRSFLGDEIVLIEGGKYQSKNAPALLVSLTKEARGVRLENKKIAL